MPKAVSVAAAQSIAKSAANPAPKVPVHQAVPVFPRYAHPINNQLLAAQHAKNALAEWRKMYGLLIHHYESNGHSCVNSTQNPQLCQWLKHQQFKYEANALSARQVQQLRLMKVEFIDQNQVKLGKKCERKKCTRFAAFEGFCHEHFSVGFATRKSPPEQEIILPAYKRNKLTTHDSKNQQFRMSRANLALMPSRVPTRKLIEDATDLITNSQFHQAKTEEYNHTPVRKREPTNSANKHTNISSNSPKKQQHCGSETNTASKNNGPAVSLQNKHNHAIWLKHYGSLILFYEIYGHCNVEMQYRNDIATPSLVTWVNIQRERYKKGLLSDEEVKRLNLLHFSEHINEDIKTADTTRPQIKSRCIVKECGKFAVFNGKCHAHYTNEINDATTIRSAKVCETSQATSLSREKRKIQVATDGDASSDSNSRPAKHFKEHHLAINNVRKNPVFIPPREPNLTAGAGRKFPIYVPTEQPHVRGPKKKKTPVSKPQYPLVGFSKQRNGLYTLVDSQDKATNTKSKDISREQIISKLSNYISNLSSSANCITVQNHIHTQCTCLHFLRNKAFAIEAVSNAILDYYEMAPKEKKHYAVERMRMAENAAEGRKINYHKEGPLRIFILPLSYEYLESAVLPQANDTTASNNNLSREAQISQLFRHKICSASWHNLHNIGREKKDTLQKYIKGDTSVIRHKACGNKNRGKDRARESLRALLLSLLEEHGNGNAGDGLEEDVVLPPSFSKRQLWHRWMREQGWFVQILDRKKGTMAKSKDWELLPGFYVSEADAVENGGKMAGQKMSFTNFTFFWRAEFPKLKVVDGMMKGSHYLSQKESVRELLQSLFDEYSEYDKDPEEVVVLPSCYSKKQLWHDWVKEQGWWVKMDKGKIAKAKDWELLPGFYATEAEAAENGGIVAGKKMSYASFYLFWRDEFPRLKVVEGTRSKGKAASFMDDCENDG